MAFDECVENPARYEYAKASCERTARWIARCKEALARYNAEPDAVNPGQQLWGINQGATFKDLRIWHMKEIAKLDLPGYAIGGLAVGEPTEIMYEIIEAVERQDKTFCLGVQFHPEFKSRPNRPHPLFRGLIAAAAEYHAAK